MGTPSDRRGGGGGGATEEDGFAYGNGEAMKDKTNQMRKSVLLHLFSIGWMSIRKRAHARMWSHAEAAAGRISLVATTVATILAKPGLSADAALLAFGSVHGSRPLFLFFQFGGLFFLHGFCILFLNGIKRCGVSLYIVGP